MRTGGGRLFRELSHAADSHNLWPEPLQVGQLYGGYYDDWNTPRGAWFKTDSQTVKAQVLYVVGRP